MLTSQRWSFSAPLLSCGQLPTSPLSTSSDHDHCFQPAVRLSCKKCCKGLHLPLALCATCAVYWLTTSPRQSHAPLSLPGWTTVTHYWVAQRRRLLTNYSTPEQPGQSHVPEPGSHGCQDAHSLATLASGEVDRLWMFKSSRPQSTYWDRIPGLAMIAL